MTSLPRPTTRLRQRMIEDMKLRNLSPHTVQANVDRVAAFAKRFGKSPQLLGPADVRAYLVFLVEEKRVSWSYYGQAICARRFLYLVTLGKDWVVKGVVSPKKEMKLPVILSRAEVTQFLGTITSLKHRAILMTAYAAELRVSEVVALQVADIDSRRMVIRVRQGKGHKDREVMLSLRLLAVPREYWKVVKPKHWLFPGQVPDRPVSAMTFIGRASRLAATPAWPSSTPGARTFNSVTSDPPTARGAGADTGAGWIRYVLIPFDSQEANRLITNGDTTFDVVTVDSLPFKSKSTLGTRWPMIRQRCRRGASVKFRRVATTLPLRIPGEPLFPSATASIQSP